MKSEKARKFIDGSINNLTVDMADHAERQLRLAMTHTAELAVSVHDLPINPYEA